MISLMRLPLILIFLTFVLNLTPSAQSHAAPSTKVSRPNDAPIIDSTAPDVILARTRNLAKEAHFVGLSYWSGNLKSRSENTQSLGLTYSFTNYESPESGFEYGGAILTNGLFGLHVGLKQIFWHMAESEPYLRLGFGSLFDASDGLPTFTNSERYQLRFAVGLENISHRRHLRGEIQISYGILGTIYSSTLGWAF